MEKEFFFMAREDERRHMNAIDTKMFERYY
jgi:hypothetical protein